MAATAAHANASELNEAQRNSEALRVALASLVGSTIEWYDFFLYGTATALVFNKLFFPNVSPLVGSLLALSTYATGFLARPVGGLVFGVIGDRHGRKAALVTTLLMVGIATVLVGLLPTYDTKASAASRPTPS